MSVSLKIILSLSTIGSSRRGNSIELQIDCRQKWMETTAASVPEIIEIERPVKQKVNIFLCDAFLVDNLPDHSAAKSHVFHKLRLAPDIFNIII